MHDTPGGVFVLICRCWLSDVRHDRLLLAHHDPSTATLGLEIQMIYRSWLGTARSCAGQKEIRKCDRTSNIRFTGWHPKGLVFAPDLNCTLEVKRLEPSDVNFTTKKEAEEQALKLCKAWIDAKESESHSAAKDLDAPKVKL